MPSPQSSYAPHASKVLIVAWDGMDLTDFTGPMETLSHARDIQKQRLYKPTIASDYELSGTSQNVTISRDVSCDEAIRNIDHFDVLLVPGGGGFTATNIPDEKGLKNVLSAFLALPVREDDPRAIVSICAGVFYLAQAGLLKGKVATAHYGNLGHLKELDNTIKVVRQHYVDVGLINGFRVITSGGITSGFDALLYLVQIQKGEGVAEQARAIMDAWWRREALPQGFIQS